jgi:hypothetical protein
MPDPAAQLARLQQAGFEILKLDRFPRAIAICRQDCLALFEPAPEGLQPIGRPGWKLGEAIAVRVERQGKAFFQSKDQFLEATPERLNQLAAFEHDLNQFLLSAA